MARWGRGESGEVGRCRFLALFKGGGNSVSPRFHLFFLMLIKETKGQDGFKIFLRGCSNGKTLSRSYTSC